MSKKIRGYDIDKADIDSHDNNFKTGDLLRNFGFTRDTLRYYEKMGLIKPEQNAMSNYRQYGFYDIYRLLSIDFYKKRGIPLEDIQKIIRQADFYQLSNLLAHREKEIEKIIKREEKKLSKLKETMTFLANLQSNLNQFTIQEFPLYEIIDEFSAVSAFEEYSEKILSHIDLEVEDIFTCTIRKLTFNKEKFIDTNMYLINKVGYSKEKADTRYLKHGKCIHVVVESGRFADEELQVIENTRKIALQWADENQYTPIGVVYIFLRLILFSDEKERMFVEIWAPIE